MSGATGHEGHRKRMYEKAEKIGFENLSDDELLEIMLYSVIPRADTRPIARELTKKFGSAYGVLTADPAELVTVDGVGPAAAKFLSSLPMTLRAVAASERANAPKTAGRKAENAQKLKDYIFSQYRDTDKERIIVCYLSSALGIINQTDFESNSFDSVAVNIGNILRKAVKCGASYVLLSHNHPSGIAFPSEADRELTKEISRTLAEEGIELYDHIIIAGSEYYSFRESSE